MTFEAVFESATINFRGVVFGAATSCEGECPDAAPDPGTYRVSGLEDPRISAATMRVTEEQVIIDYETEDGAFSVTYRIDR